jgi:TonB family protein
MLSLRPPSKLGRSWIKPRRIEKLAALTAERVAKTHAQHVLMAALQGCLLNMRVCAELDTPLHAEFSKVIAAAEFVSTGEAANLVRKHRFLALDAYNDLALRVVAPRVGVEVLVTEDLRWKPDAYELTTHVFDAAHGKEHGELKVTVARSAPESDDVPMIFKDPESGVSLVTSKRKQSDFRYLPSCAKRPAPAYPHGLQGEVVMLVTVTEQSGAEHIMVVKSFDDAITRQAVKAVQGWKFKAAIGPDGKPFAVRVPIEEPFVLSLSDNLLAPHRIRANWIPFGLADSGPGSSPSR